MGYWSELLQESREMMERKMKQAEKDTIKDHQDSFQIAGGLVAGAGGAIAGMHLGATVGSKTALAAGALTGLAGVMIGGKLGHTYGTAIGEKEAPKASMQVAKSYTRAKQMLGRTPTEREFDAVHDERMERQSKLRQKEREEKMIRAHKLAKYAKQESDPMEIKQDYMARSTFAESIAEQPMQTNQNVRGWWEQSAPDALQESMIDNYIAKIRRTHKIAGGALGGIVGGTAGSFAGKTGAAIGAGLGTAAGILRGNKTSDADVAYVRKAYNKLKAELGREPSESELDHYMEENFGLTEGVSQQAPLSNRSVMNDANANFRRGSEPGPWGRSKSFAEYIAEDFRAQNPRAQMHYEPARHAPQQAVVQGRYGPVIQ